MEKIKNKENIKHAFIIEWQEVGNREWKKIKYVYNDQTFYQIIYIKLGSLFLIGTFRL